MCANVTTSVVKDTILRGKGALFEIRTSCYLFRLNRRFSQILQMTRIYVSESWGAFTSTQVAIFVDNQPLQLKKSACPKSCK